MSTSPIPEGFPTLTPYLVIRGAAEAIEFYKRAFGATEVVRMPSPAGGVMHAEIRVGNSPIMLSDEVPGMGCRSPQALGGSPVSLLLYVEDCDALFAQAEAAGAKVVRPLQNQFYGDRSGTVEDPYGHTWHISSRIEEVSAEEMRRRMAEMSEKREAGEVSS